MTEYLLDGLDANRTITVMTVLVETGLRHDSLARGCSPTRAHRAAATGAQRPRDDPRTPGRRLPRHPRPSWYPRSREKRNPTQRPVRGPRARHGRHAVVQRLNHAALAASTDPADRACTLANGAYWLGQAAHREEALASASKAVQIRSHTATGSG
jgi:hypothetical protein